MPLVEKSRRERFRPASGQNPKQTRVQRYLPIADIPVNVCLILAMGAAVGFVSGMFGIGGGFLMTPAMSLPDIAYPHVQELVDTVRESSSVAVLDGDEIVDIAR